MEPVEVGAALAAVGGLGGIVACFMRLSGRLMAQP